MAVAESDAATPGQKHPGVVVPTTEAVDTQRPCHLVAHHGDSTLPSTFRVVNWAESTAWVKAGAPLSPAPLPVGQRNLDGDDSEAVAAGAHPTRPGRLRQGPR